MAKVVGNNTNNILAGTAGDDTILGYSGLDYLAGNGGDDQLFGGNGEDVLTGGDGNDVLNGGLGADSLIGGLGDDLYYVNTASDSVVEQDKNGNDTIISSVTYTTPTTVENLTLSGKADSDGTGNQYNNIIIGNSGKNKLTGNGGNDFLDGKSGIDTLIGGGGDDIYTIDNIKDIIIENTNGGVNDTVISSVTYTLPAEAELENLTLVGNVKLNGVGNGRDNLIIGNTANNTLIGEGGDDQLYGGAGNDILRSVSVSDEGSDYYGTDKLWGDKGNDTLIGDYGDDYLDGGQGIDKMNGGDGSDTYYVDNIGDKVVETKTSSSDSVDTVISTINYTLGSELEDLQFSNAKSFSNHINGTGNELDNTIKGTYGNNNLKGLSGNDTLYGDLGNDKLYGGNGDDILEAGNGRDSLFGGKGNDTLRSSLPGFDILVGGAGKDIFEIDLSDLLPDPSTIATLQISDFKSGADVIHLKDMVFIGEQAFNPGNAMNQLRFDATNQVLLGSIDADTNAEFSIKLVGVTSLTSTDVESNWAANS